MGADFEHLLQLLRTDDHNQIISTLSALRSHLNGKSKKFKIDSSFFKHIVTFLKIPNHKILSYSISIIANCCIHDRYVQDFSNTEGVMDLMLIIRNIEHDDIECRSWRLVGNLLSSSTLCKEFLERGLAEQINNNLDKMESFTPDTKLMIFRVIGKVWSHKIGQTRLKTGDFFVNFKKCLDSTNPQIIEESLKLLETSLLKSKKFAVDRAFAEQLMKISKTSEYFALCMKCLTQLLSFYRVSSFIEGTGIPEIFIDYMLKEHTHRREMLIAFYGLCQEAAVRNKVKNSNILPKLIELTKEREHVSILISIFHTFLCDDPSLNTLAQSPLLLDVLVENVPSKRAVQLLTAIARLEHPVPNLVTPHNLEIFTTNPKCMGILTAITNSRQYFGMIVLSGKVWSLHKAGCSFEGIGSSWFAEGTVEHWFVTGDKQQKDTVALAVPFLVQPRNFKLLYRYLAQFNAMPIILEAFKKSPTEQAVVESIVRLAYLFREHKDETKRQEHEHSERLFQKGQFSGISPCNRLIKNADTKLITFELDDGSRVAGPRDSLCKVSPVLDAMLNGHFAEAGQDCVTFTDCSRAAMAALVKLVDDKLDSKALEIKPCLELISLTDRLLMPSLCDDLTRELIISGRDSAEVYLWARNAGSAANATFLRLNSYWQLLSSSSKLLPALELPDCRDVLIDDVSAFLMSCLNDLL